MSNRLPYTLSLLLTLLLGFTVPSWALGSDAANTDRVAAVQDAVHMDTAELAVEAFTGQVLELISAGQDYANDDPERFYAEVEAVLAPMVDFPRFARNVMGPAYKRASADQRDRFAEKFKWSLVRTYSLALTQFRDGEVRVVPPRKPARDPDKVKVVQEVTFRGRTYVAVYLMRRGDERVWRVQNIIIEGVNIGVNFRTQFAHAFRTAGGDKDNAQAIDEVIESWGGTINRDKIARDTTTRDTAS